MKTIQLAKMLLLSFQQALGLLQTYGSVETATGNAKVSSLVDKNQRNVISLLFFF